ncbi:hypothetical protein HDIA_0364 [Hartmannibacter diazotrophicus]|uniref:Uncharacterized protein n=1 Tax=Hartmannibacter diazotrophicus TaxID=1482074 RepID=A0A2C9D357_9HYPH|nr:hypothetical protein [Hartmannibacter diazotrophicus]SON53905.1 hypothetical protein HDIA_0364 [Hartmannibacter diazotrophicus]
MMGIATTTIMTLSLCVSGPSGPCHRQAEEQMVFNGNQIECALFGQQAVSEYLKAHIKRRLLKYRCESSDNRTRIGSI